MKKVDFTIDVELSVTANVRPGIPGWGPTMDHAGGEQEEPPEVEDMEVSLTIDDKTFDITSKLPWDVLFLIRNFCEEEAGNL